MPMLSPEKHRRFVRHPLNILGSLLSGIGAVTLIASPLGIGTFIGLAVLAGGIALAFRAYAIVQQAPE